MAGCAHVCFAHQREQEAEMLGSTFNAEKREAWEPQGLERLKADSCVVVWGEGKWMTFSLSRLQGGTEK